MTDVDQLIQECSKFALFVANRDADTWNGLCRRLTSIWKESESEKNFDFVGFNSCHRVADGMFGTYFHAHCQDNLRNLFYQHSRAVIALAAQEILFRVKRELQIENYYE